MADDELRDLLDDEGDLPPDSLDEKFYREDDLAEDMLDQASDAVEQTQAGPSPSAIGYTEPMMTLPPCKATMECLRGPCQYYWHLTSRMAAPGRDDLDIRVKNNEQCNLHQEPTKLGSQNIFYCTRWWPSQLAFVPESLRPMARPTLRRFMEKRLQRAGYDFKWHVWPHDIFHAQDWPQFRGSISLDGKVRPPTVFDLQNKERAKRRSAETR